MANLNNLIVNGTARFLNEIKGKIDWSNILNKPTIPTVNNATLTIQKNGTSVATFTANSATNATANITVPTVTDTYSSTGTDATSGKAVAAALGTLDGSVSGSAGAGKTLTAFSQTDGKVSATFGNISITKSQVSDLGTIGAAASKGVDTTVTSGSANLVTSGAVYTAIDNLPEPMIFKGTVGDSSVTVTWANLPAPAAANEGYTYKATSARTTSQTSTLTQNVKSGDTIISNATNWVVIPSGDEPSGTVTSVATGTDLSGGTITSTGTISHANSGVTAGTYKSVTVNARGHVTAGTNPTTLGGYGITDAKIANGVITLGSNTITPITDVSGKADKSATVSTVAYDTTNAKFTKTINGTTTDIAKLATTSVGSASAGTAIAADDITAWSAGSLPSLTVTNTTINVPQGISTLLEASISGSALTLSEVSVSTGSVTVGSASGWSAGTLPSLSYTARSIPNISVSNKTVATGFTTT